MRFINRYLSFAENSPVPIEQLKPAWQDINESSSKLPGAYFDWKLVDPEIKIDTTLTVCADSTICDGPAHDFLRSLTEQVNRQPESEGRTMVLETLAETTVIYSVWGPPENEDDIFAWGFDINMLVSLDHELGFLADEPKKSLSFFEFSHEDWLTFEAASFFERAKG